MSVSFTALANCALQVHVLEFNPTPDIKQTGARLDFMIDALVDGVVSIAVDKKVPGGTNSASTHETHSATGSDISKESECALPSSSPAHRLTWKQVYEKAWPGAQGGSNITMD